MAPSPRAPRRLVAGSLVVLALVAVGCGGTSSAPLEPVGAPVQPGAGGQSGTGGGPAGGDQPGGGSQGGQSGSGSQSGSDGQTAAGDVLAVLPDGTKIVYTGTLSLQVSDVDAALTAGRQVVGRVGGFLAGSRQTREGDEHVASSTYRIPAERWEEALEGLRGLGTVVGEETNAEEVTTQLVDLAARIRTKEASEAAVQRLTEGATSVDQLIQVERELSTLRTDIERLKAQQAALTDRAALGTLTVTYGKVVAAIADVVEEAKWDARKDVSAATDTLVGMLQALTSAGIWFGIVWLPILLGLAVLALIARFILRRTGLASQVGRIGTPNA